MGNLRFKGMPKIRVMICLKQMFLNIEKNTDSNNKAPQQTLTFSYIFYVIFFLRNKHFHISPLGCPPDISAFLLPFPEGQFSWIMCISFGNAYFPSILILHVFIHNQDIALFYMFSTLSCMDSFSITGFLHPHYIFVRFILTDTWSSNPSI